MRKMGTAAAAALRSVRTIKIKRILAQQAVLPLGPILRLISLLISAAAPARYDLVHHEQL